MIDDREFETSDQCSMWRISVLAGCGEASWLERLQFAIHASRCPQCRERRRRSAGVAGLLMATLAPVAASTVRVIPIRRVFMVTLWATLAALALSSAYRMTFASEPDLATSLKNHKCKPTSVGPVVRPEIEEEAAIAEDR